MTTILSILVLISVLIAEPAESNMGVITGGASDSFWDGNKGSSKDVMLNKITIAASIVFVISLVLLAKI